MYSYWNLEGGMIKRIKTPEELSEIFGEIPEKWVQFLTEGINNPRIFIIAEMDNGLVGYIVALDSVVWPVSDYFTIILEGGNSVMSMEFLKSEAQKQGAKKIVMAVNELTQDKIEAGFEQESVNISMVI